MLLDGRTYFAMQESKNVKSVTNKIKKFLDAKYEKVNLKEITTKLKYSNSDEQFLLYRLLKKHENMYIRKLYTFIYQLKKYFCFKNIYG